MAALAISTCVASLTAFTITPARLPLPTRFQYASKPLTQEALCGTRRQRHLPLQAILKEDIISDPSLDQVTLDSKFDSNETVVEINSASDSDQSSPVSLWGVPLQSIILLNLAAVIWGTQHAVIKSVVDNISIGPDVWLREWLAGVLETYHPENVQVMKYDGDAAASFTLARFGLAALLAAPYTPGIDLFFKKVTGQTDNDAGKDNMTGLRYKSNEGIDEQTQQSLDLVTTTNESVMLNTTSTETNEVALSWRYGIELGIYMFLGYAFQAIGLQTTTASRSGFLIYLNVKLVPFFSFLIFGKRIRPSTLASALIAFCGTALLSLDNASTGSINSSDGLNWSLNAGDWWSIAAAAASAMFILRMEGASKTVSKSSELNAASLWTVCLLSFIWTVVITSKNTAGILVGDGLTANVQSIATTVQQTVDSTLSTLVNHPLQMFYLSAITTTIANYIQSKGQKDISAERASIIYAMDPVYGAIVANLLLGEQLGVIGWLGSGLIFAAAATNAIFDFGRTDNDQ